jgi:hypothetical protein
MTSDNLLSPGFYPLNTIKYLVLGKTLFLKRTHMSNNPLRQYFRRPAVYLKLPSGGNSYGPDVLEMTETGELPVFPMTAIDEITARTPDALFNGTAVAELIKSCVPNIKNPWAINSTDLDAILIGIRAAAGGDSLDIESTCPKCTEVSNYGVNLVAVLTTLKAADYSKELEINDLTIKFRPLTYKEMNEGAIAQFEVQKMFENISSIEDDDQRNAMSNEALKRITDLTMDLLSKTIEYINTPTVNVSETEFILDFLQNCDRNTYLKIRDYNTELKASTELKPLDIKCVSCGNEYTQPFTLNPADFFV